MSSWTIIYRDSERTISYDGEQAVQAVGRLGTKTQVLADCAIDAVREPQASQLRAKGHDVDSMIGLYIGGKALFWVLPAAARDAMCQAIDRTRAYRAIRDAESAERARKARDWGNLHNEGGEGYNPYLDSDEDVDRTPYHKGDDRPE